MIKMTKMIKIVKFLYMGTPCILRAPAVADALTTGRGAVIERSTGGAGQDCL